ncbi:MAG: monovalent cation/H+ antiporter complex subunit F [Acidimicrobiales bacterium]
MFDTALVVSFAILMLSAALAVARIVSSPSLADRVIALDLLVVIALIAIAGDAARRDTGDFLDVLVVVALLGFLATVSVARFIERRGAR